MESHEIENAIHALADIGHGIDQAIQSTDRASSEGAQIAKIHYDNVLAYMRQRPLTDAPLPVGTVQTRAVGNWLHQLKTELNSDIAYCEPRLGAVGNPGDIGMRIARDRAALEYVQNQIDALPSDH